MFADLFRRAATFFKLGEGGEPKLALKLLQSFSVRQPITAVQRYAQHAVMDSWPV